MNDCTIIVLGATGDLAKRKLIPAIYGLIQEKKLSNFALVGAALTKTGADQMMAQARPFVAQFDEETWRTCCSCAWYYPVDFNNPADFETLQEHINNIEQEKNLSGNRLIYCAVPSSFFSEITITLAQTKIIQKGRTGANGTIWHRIVYEKPFGTNLESAREINQTIARLLDEKQVFRIDHYLAKEIVATIAMIRFTNRVFEPLWSHQHIDYVQIILSETLGIEGRGVYYDGYGALRDVAQNHLLQLLALVTMEAPERLSGDFIRNKKAEILKSIQPIGGLLGQYVGYQEEPGVKKNSTTETFAAIELQVKNDRWRGVPFYLRTGKLLNKKEVVIFIRFKPVECLITSSYCPSEPNYLIIRITPDEGFSLELNAKKPGVFDEIIPVTMDYCHDCLYAPRTPEAYELLLKEVLKGEPSVSVRFDEIEYSWRIIDQLYAMKLPLYLYEKGTRGPKELQDFEKKHTMRWLE